MPITSLNCLIVRAHTQALMYAPVDSDLRATLFRTLLKHEAISLIEKGISSEDQYITIGFGLYDALKGGDNLATHQKTIDLAIKQGWVTAMAFMYLCRQIFAEDKKKFSKNKLIDFINMYEPEIQTVPGFDQLKISRSPTYTKDALKKMWPVAHLWSSYFSFDCINKKPQNTTKEFLYFLKDAKAYREAALYHGLYDHICPHAYANEHIADIALRPSKTPYTSDFSEAEREVLNAYISHSTFARNNRPLSDNVISAELPKK